MLRDYNFELDTSLRGISISQLLYSVPLPVEEGDGAGPLFQRRDGNRGKLITSYLCNITFLPLANMRLGLMQAVNRRIRRKLIRIAYDSRSNCQRQACMARISTLPTTYLAVLGGIVTVHRRVWPRSGARVAETLCRLPSAGDEVVT